MTQFVTTGACGFGHCFDIKTGDKPVTITNLYETGQFTVTYTDADEWNDSDESFMQIQISRAISSGVTYFKGPYQVAATIAGEGTSPNNPFSPFANYPIGQQAYFRIRVSFADGRLSDVQYIGPIAITQSP